MNILNFLFLFTVFTLISCGNPGDNNPIPVDNPSAPIVTPTPGYDSSIVGGIVESYIDYMRDPRVSQQKFVAAMGLKEAYKIFYGTITGIRSQVIIAIIDSGVEYKHEDLAPSAWINTREIPDNRIDDDKNGYVDDVYGYNFASNIPNPSPQKISGNNWAHGTRVAGLAAATGGNGVGVIGVMPTAKIMSLNAMGKNSGFDRSHLIKAIRYAADNGAHVINLSVGSASPASAALTAAIEYALNKNVVVLAAAGNSGGRIGANNSIAGLAPKYKGLLTVGNLQSASNKISSSSSYSTTYVKIGAPGTHTANEKLYTVAPVGYGMFSGTSAATPVAAGAVGLAVGLIQSRGYNYTPGDIEDLLLDSSDKVPGLMNYFKDGNALNVTKLAQLVNQRYPYRGR